VTGGVPLIWQEDKEPVGSIALTCTVDKESIGFENYERWATSPFDSTLELVSEGGNPSTALEYTQNELVPHTR
jgi:hypothetical protein